MTVAVRLEGNPLFETYLFYSSVLILKMLLMTAMTTMHRFKNKVIRNKNTLFQLLCFYFVFLKLIGKCFFFQAFANPEDASFMKVKVKINDVVERVRR